MKWFRVRLLCMVAMTMNKPTWFLLFTMVCAVLNLNGATVEWPWVCFFNDNSSGLNALTSPRHELFVDVYISSTAEGVSISFDESSSHMGYMEYMAIVARAEKGELNNETNLKDYFSPQYYASEEFFEKVVESDHPYRSDGPLTMARGESVYLAIGAWDFNAPDEYLLGWAQLSVDMDGNLHLDNSAVARGGDSIIVGDLPIPEPSSALLLLVGGAMLALRRRRSGCSVSTSDSWMRHDSRIVYFLNFILFHAAEFAKIQVLLQGRRPVGWRKGSP